MFLENGTPPRADARCPVCGALERHRAGWLVLRELVRPSADILHVAPEAFWGRCLSSAGASYTTFDLNRDDVDVRGDLTDTPLPDCSYDLIVCSHVLEHIVDDTAAMREMYRMLRPGGVTFVMVPWRPRTVTFEDATVTEPHQRERLFGQWDHVRWYGDDIDDRLRAAGFLVERVDGSKVQHAEPTRMGLRYGDVWLCRRSQ